MRDFNGLFLTRLRRASQGVFRLPVLLTICVSAAAAVALANDQKPKRMVVREARVAVPLASYDGGAWRVEGGRGLDFSAGVIVPSVAKIDDPVDFEGSSSAPIEAGTQAPSGAAIAPGEEIQNSNRKGSGAKSERGVKK